MTRVIRRRPAPQPVADSGEKTPQKKSKLPSGQYRIFAVSAKGLEEVTAKELEALGLDQVQAVRGGVTFQGGLEAIYKSNLWVRTATRILVEKAHIPFRSLEEIYERLLQVAWENEISADQTIAVSVTVGGESHGEKIHTHYAALKIKDAIVDRIREKTGRRPSVFIENPDIPIQVYLHHGMATVYFDSSGRSLHERGYRREAVAAPLKETLAAGLVLLSGWDPSRPFFDPMCGSGTLVIEAAWIAMNIAPGSLRESFPFQSWLGFDFKLWERMKGEALQARKDPAAPLVGYDRDRRAIASAWENAKAAGLEKWVHFERRDWEQADPAAFRGARGVLVTNPPWGERIGDLGELKAFYGEIGNRFKHHFPGWTAWVFTGNLELAKCVGLKPTRKIHLFHGPVECRFLRFELYEGKKHGEKKQVSDPH